MALPAVIESGLNEAGTAIALIVHPERGAAAVLDYVNQPFAAVMQTAERDLTGAVFQTVLDLVAAAECREKLLRSLQAGTPIELEVPLSANGVESWLGLRLCYPPPAGCGARNAILIGRDITVQHKNATQEDKTRQMLAQIFMRISAPVTIVGQAGELVMCNTAFRQLTGFSAEELKRMRVRDLTPPDFAAASDAAREAQFAGGERYEMEFETLVKGGGRVPVRLTSMLLADSDQHYRVVTLIPRHQAAEPPPTEAAALTAAAKAHAERGKGELQVISLEALRALAGAEWPRIAVDAVPHAEEAIRKRLQRNDVVSRLGEAEFILWLGSGNYARNASTLQAIMRDVRLGFLTEFGGEIASFVNSTPVPGLVAPRSAAKPKEMAAAEEATSRQGH